MPPVREIDLSDGVKIVSAFGSYHITEQEILDQAYASEQEASEGLTDLVQAEYEDVNLLSKTCDPHPDDPICQDPPELLVNQRIEKIKGKDYFIETRMWVAVHVYTLSPLKLTVRCQSAMLGPIEGEWW